MVIRAAILLAVLIAAPAGAAPDPWRALHRPLHVPRIEPGSPCPVSAPDPKGDLSRLGFAGTAWGNGPAYPAGLGKDRPVLRFTWPASASAFAPSAWSGNKVLWIVDRSYRRGPILIRGRQLDGPNLLRFDGGIIPARELPLTRPGDRPSYTRVRAPGCYGYQIDGASFSRVIVFEAPASE